MSTNRDCHPNSRPVPTRVFPTSLPCLGGEPSSYRHVRSERLDLFGRNCQFHAGISHKIIGQKLFHGIPAFNLCAVLINVLNIVGIESGERFCVSLVVGPFVFSGIVISCLAWRGRLILLLVTRLRS
jgi:hypothetical protein